jgi:hypothetical protein
MKMSYVELSEKYNHFRETAIQYERLYGEYLEKYILG